MTTIEQIDRATIQLIEDLTTEVALLRAERDQLRDLGKPKHRGPAPRSFAQRFEEGLAHGKTNPSYEAVYQLMMSETGGVVNRHVQENGFDLALFSAVIRAYFSHEGREVRTKAGKKMIGPH